MLPAYACAESCQPQASRIPLNQRKASSTSMHDNHVHIHSMHKTTTK
jgi:hypothetical protein